MEFIEDADYWSGMLSGAMKVESGDPDNQKQDLVPIFTLKVDDKPVWLQVTMYMPSQGYLISVKGKNLGRKEQERWQGIIRGKEVELEGDEYVRLSL
jgi:hypothetical protein